MRLNAALDFVRAIARGRSTSQIFLVVMLATMTIGPALAADETFSDDRIEPFTPWHLEAGANACILWRGFGSETDPLILRFENKTSLELFKVAILGDRIRGWEPAKKMAIRFGQGATQEISNYAMGLTPRGSPVVVINGLGLVPFPSDGQAWHPPSPELVSLISDVTISQGTSTLTLKTGPISAPIAQMRLCTNQLMTSWGIDPERYEAGTRSTPSNDPRSWLKGAKIPSSSAVKGQNIVLNYRLTVGIDGKATACAIEESLSDEQVNKSLCDALMRNARFRPAADSNRQPMPDLYWSRIAWPSP